MQNFQNLDEQFTEQQLQELDKPLDKRFVSTRKGASGRTLKYLEGHDAIDQANRLFGYGNWAYETLECLQTVISDPFTGDAIGICYKAKVKLTVRGCVSHIIEVGSQPVAACSAAKASPTVVMESHEQAEKGAVTDALKRALRTFGEQFGNGLYGDGRVIIDEETPTVKEPVALPAPPAMAAPPVALTQIENDAPLPGEECKVSATDEQKCAIIRLCKRLTIDAPQNINGMTRNEARDWIALLQKRQSPGVMKAPLTQNKEFSII